MEGDASMKQHEACRVGSCRRYELLSTWLVNPEGHGSYKDVSRGYDLVTIVNPMSILRMVKLSLTLMANSENHATR